MSIKLILVLISLLVFMVIFLFIEPIMSKHKIKSKDEYGSARFSTENEINKNFSKEKISNIKEVGFPVWYDKNINYVWFDKETPHYVYLGSSGSGKSVTAVIPMTSFVATAKKKRSLFITDPKGEIYNATSQMLKDNGYNVLTIDFRHPELSSHINILEPIIKEYENYMEYEKKANKVKSKQKKLEYNNISMYSYAECNRLITSLSAMITLEKVDVKDPFWNNSAKNLLEGLIGFFLEEYKAGNIKREQITMTSIRKFQNSTMDQKNARVFKSYLEKKEYGQKSKDSLIPIISTSENTYKSITSVFSEKMAIFDDINVANVTYKSDFDFDILGKEKTALFVIVPDEDKIYYTLVTIIVGLLYKELVKLANKNENKKLPIEIDWLLDEFANCPPLNDIEAIVSVARSRGMRFHFFIQSLAQLNNVYGKEVAQIILDNSGLVYLKTNTMETAEEVSKRLGKKTIESRSISQSMSLTKYDGNKSLSLMARDLLTPDEVKNLHYKTIIFPNVGYPIFRDTVIYNKLSCYSTGVLDRDIHPLIDLKDTYITIEKMKENEESVEGKDIDTENEEYKSIEDQEKKNLKVAIKKVEAITKGKFDSFCFEKANLRTFSTISLKDRLTPKERSAIRGRIDRNAYHVIIDDLKIEVHLKNPIGLELDRN